MVLGGREDVQDAAAHGELAAAADHVHPGVGGFGQAADHIGEGHLVADRQRHRLQLAQSLDQRLKHRTHRCDDHVQRRRAVVVLAAGAAPRAGAPRCPIAATAARAATSPNWGTPRWTHPAGSSAAPRPGLRSPARWPSRPAPLRRWSTAACPPPVIDQGRPRPPPVIDQGRPRPRGDPFPAPAPSRPATPPATPAAHRSAGPRCALPPAGPTAAAPWRTNRPGRGLCAVRSGSFFHLLPVGAQHEYPPVRRN